MKARGPQGDVSSHAVSKAEGNSFDASRTEGDRALEAALGLCWLGLCCLVSGAQIKKKTFGTWKLFSSASFAT